MSATPPDTLRIALVAGSLGQGGAEKQLLYMVRALHQAGVQLKVFSLTRGEVYQEKLSALGHTPVWIGRRSSPLARIVLLARLLAEYRPHLIQSTHNFTNLHVALAAALLRGRGFRAHHIGSLRSDPNWTAYTSALWGPWLLRLPSNLIANSFTAREHAVKAGVSPEKVFVLPNVIDLEEFDRRAATTSGAMDLSGAEQPGVIAAAVSRLIPVKRLDIFLHSLALARQEVPELRGLLIGDGSQRAALEKLAADLGLLPNGVRFLGQREDVPALLSQVDMLLITSEFEGFPNVLLEAMASGLPVVTTPAGDAGRVVHDGINGYVVSGEPARLPVEIARRIVQLAGSPALRRQMGVAGRRQVEQHYSFEGLATRLLAIYREIAVAHDDHRLLNILSPRYVQT